MTAAEFAFASARLHARHGARPDESRWRALESSRTAAHYLAQARAGGFAAWTEGLPAPDGDVDADRAERHLHARWQAQVDEIAAWLPPRWRAPVRCLGDLPALPREATVPDALPAWAARWRAALPADADPRLPWRAPAEWLFPRLAGPAGQAGRPAGSPGAHAALVRLFRRHDGTALAVLAALALLALDLERLRGGLVARALFDAEGR